MIVSTRKLSYLAGTEILPVLQPARRNERAGGAGYKLDLSRIR